MENDPNATRERYEGDTQERSWDANVKRTYDEFQDISLVAARRSQGHHDELSQLSVQALQNAIETANQVGKNAMTVMHKDDLQATRHGDLSIDRQWNLDEVSALAAGSTTGVVAILARLASTFDDDATLRAAARAVCGHKG